MTINSLPPELQAVLDEMEAIQRVQAEVTIDRQGLERAFAVLRFQAPDRLYFAYQGSDAAQNAEGVAIGEEYFLKIASDWFKSSAAPPPTPDPNAMDDYPFQIQPGGTTKVEGKECRLYTFSEAPSGPEAVLTSSATSEVCVADNRVQRLVWRSPSITISAIFDYDTPVEIERPTTAR